MKVIVYSFAALLLTLSIAPAHGACKVFDRLEDFSLEADEASAGYGGSTCFDTLDDYYYDEDLLMETVDSVASLYDSAGVDVVWYLRQKLVVGEIHEVFAVIRLFEKNRVFPLLPDVIAVTSRYQSAIASERSESVAQARWIENFRRDALISTAKHFGLWDAKYRASYPDFDTKSWEALFFDTMSNSPDLFE